MFHRSQVILSADSNSVYSTLSLVKKWSYKNIISNVLFTLYAGKLFLFLINWDELTWEAAVIAYWDAENILFGNIEDNDDIFLLILLFSL
jgi:hypothetical protein